MLTLEEDLNTSDDTLEEVVVNNFRNVVACTLDETRVLAGVGIKHTLLA